MSEQEKKPLMTATPDRKAFNVDAEKLVGLIARNMVYEGVLSDLVARGIGQNDLNMLLRFRTERVINSSGVEGIANEAISYGVEPDRAQQVVRDSMQIVVDYIFPAINQGEQK